MQRYIKYFKYFSKLLTKLDLIKKMGQPPMSLEYYLEATGLSYLFDKGLPDQNKKSEDSKFKSKYFGFIYELSEFIDLWGKVSFQPLYVENKKLMLNIIIEADKGNGFYFEEK